MLRIALLASSADRNVTIMKTVLWPSKQHSIGLIHRARAMAFGVRPLVVSISRMDCGDRFRPIGMFLTTHECSRSFISDMAPKPCINSVWRLPFLIHSADAGESISNRMSPFGSVFALMNWMVSGMLSWEALKAVSARLALATRSCGSWLSRPWVAMPCALVKRTCFFRSPARAIT